MADQSNWVHWKFQSPDGTIREFDAPDDEDFARAELEKRVKQENLDEYGHLPLWQKPLVLADDFARASSHAFTLGGVEHLSGNPEKENYLTERSRERLGWLGRLLGDTAGYASQAVLLPSLAGKGGAAFGGPAWFQRGVTTPLLAGIETGAQSGVQAALEGKDVKEGIFSGAIAGPLGVAIPGAVKKVAQGVKWIDENLLKSVIGKGGDAAARGAAKAATTVAAPFKRSPATSILSGPEAVAKGVGGGPPNPLPVPPAAAPAVPAVPPVPPPSATPVVSPIPPVAPPVASSPIPPVAPPVAPVVPKGPLAAETGAPKPSQALLAARRAAFKAQESLDAAQRQLAGIKDPRGKQNMKTKIKFLQGAKTSAKHKLQVLEDEFAAQSKAAPAAPAEVAAPAGPLAAPAAPANDALAAQEAKFSAMVKDLNELPAGPEKMALRTAVDEEGAKLKEMRAAVAAPAEDVRDPMVLINQRAEELNREMSLGKHDAKRRNEIRLEMQQLKEKAAEIKAKGAAALETPKGPLAETSDLAKLEKAHKDAEAAVTKAINNVRAKAGKGAKTEALARQSLVEANKTMEKAKAALDEARGATAPAGPTGPLSSEKVLPEPKTPPKGKAGTKPVSTNAPDFDAAKTGGNIGKQAKKAKGNKTGPTSDELRAESIARVDKAVKEATLAAEGPDTHGFDSEIAQRFKSMLADKEFRKSLSPEEISVMERTVKGDPAMKAGRFLGHLASWQSLGTTTLGGGGAWLLGVDPIGIAIGAGGIGGLGTLGRAVARGGSKRLVDETLQTLHKTTPKAPIIDPARQETIERTLRMLLRY